MKSKMKRIIWIGGILIALTTLIIAPVFGYTDFTSYIADTGKDTTPPTIEIINPTEGYFHFSGIRLFPTRLNIVADTMGLGGFRVRPVQVRVTDDIDFPQDITVYMYVYEDEQGQMNYNSNTNLHERKWIGPDLGVFTLNITAEDTSNNSNSIEMEVWYFCFIPEP